MSTLVVAFLCFQAIFIQTAFGQIGWCGDAYPLNPYNYGPATWAGSYGDIGSYSLPGLYGFAAGPYGFVGSYGYGALDIAEPIAGKLVANIDDAYGGSGVGEVAVAGELPAGGATAVSGQVPILGAVEFVGPVRAVGTVTIAGTCGCGCAGPYIY